ncbi:MAG TPA: PEP-CTERM sorting domain-containing protein [Chthoniobacteraceae bacterium]|nr:PEP-CTERM sorting domain-containing protein [Chthoniobacteraceae bacterium]
MKQHTLLHIALFTGMFCASPLAKAADSWNSALTESKNWDTADWTKNGLLQPTGTYPAASDDLVSLSSSGGDTYLHLNGNRTFDTLEATSGIVRIRSGRIGGNGSALLTVNTIRVTGGTLSLHNRNASSPLTVHTGQVNLSGGDLALGLYNSTGSPYITTFTVSGSTTIGADRTLGITHPLFTSISLGAVSNDGTLDLAWTSTAAGSDAFTSMQPYVVEVASLSSTSGMGKITTTVSAAGVAPRPTLLIKGNDISTVFNGVIEDGVATASLAIKKEGNSVQRFNKADGNTYSGGTEISGGILTAQNASGGSAFGTGAIAVKNGGTLAAYYRMRIELGDGHSVTVEDGGTLSAGYGGTPAIATLTLSGASNGTASTLIMEEGAAFSFRLDPLNERSDRIAFTEYTAGDLLLNANAVNVTGLDDVGSWQLFSFDADVSGEAWWNNDSLVLGTGFGQWAGLASFRYENNGIYLDVVPEPGTTALLVLVLGGGIALKLRSRFSRATV